MIDDDLQMSIDCSQKRLVAGILNQILFIIQTIVFNIKRRMVEGRVGRKCSLCFLLKMGRLVWLCSTKTKLDSMGCAIGQK
jgi:hypothetical protein